MNRFEQLIEYVINDEEAKAKELFHDIVVEKSRQIYENIMAEEAEEELEEGAEEELDEAAEEDLEESAEEDLEESAEEDLEEGLMDEVDTEEQSDMSMEDDDSLGGDSQDKFVSDVEVDDSGEGGDEPATKDDILNLEDKLDQLMAEFEDLMSDGDGDGFGPEEGGDAIEMDDTEEMDDEGQFMEAVTLKAAPKPVTSEEGSVNKKSINNSNGGANSPISKSVKPVHAGGEMGGRHDAPGAYSNSTKELIGKVGNTPAQSTQKPSPATKPTLGQASGVNTKSPVAKS